MGKESNNVPKGKSCFYHAEERKSRARVYRQSGDHVSSTCTRVTTMEETKKSLAQKGMCFNKSSWLQLHRNQERPELSIMLPIACQKCGEKHNTYICGQEDQLLTATATCHKELVAYPKLPESQWFLRLPPGGPYGRQWFQTSPASPPYLGRQWICDCKTMLGYYILESIARLLYKCKRSL